MIKLEHVSKSYSAGIPALNDISLNIEEGEFVFIVGNSGSGKSTLIKLLLKELEPTKGVITINNRNLNAIRRKQIPKYRRNVGVVFQDFRLLKDRNVYENVAFAQKVIGTPARLIRSSVPTMLSMVGLAAKYKSYPKQLSGGEQQRVAIARALAKNPKVLLCDEAASALDPNTTAGVLSLLKDINTRLGITIVVITHEMSVIQEICDRVAIIDGGLIAEEGGVEEIFRAPKTKIGQELVMHEGTNREAYTGKLPYSYRLVFKGGSENEPVLGQMMIELKNVVNILAANTRTIENQAFGQMLVQFPEEKEIRQKMIQYLIDRGVEVEEVEYV